MAGPSTSKLRTPGAGVLGPMNPPAYLTWLAVVLSPLLDVGTQDSLTLRLVTGFVGQIAFAPLFVMRAVLEERAAPTQWLRIAIVSQALAALMAVWGHQDKMQAVLLVLVAAQMPVAGGTRWSTSILAAANLVLLVMFTQLFPPLKAIQMEIAYLAFQLFAALVAAYAYRAHEAREATMRINAELLATRHLLEEGARSEERLRLSRELHDLMGHKLTALKLQLALQTRGAAPANSASQCVRLIDELLVDVRGVVTTLRQSDGVDLHQALRALHPGVPQPRVTFELDADVRVPDIRQAETILRCAQEGLTNALRHSGAAEVRVALAATPEGLTLTIEDDGRGQIVTVTPGNGLRGLQERVHQLGGRLHMEARLPRGLVLKAVLPHASIGV
jgi:signal transduction histidine kinase